MKLVKKIILSVWVNVLWATLIVLPSVVMLSRTSKVSDFMVLPLMVGIVYPVFSIVAVILIYKINPLIKNKDKRIYIIVNFILAFLNLSWTIPYAIIRFINDVIV